MDEAIISFDFDFLPFFDLDFIWTTKQLNYRIVLRFCLFCFQFDDEIIIISDV